MRYDSWYLNTEYCFENHCFFLYDHFFAVSFLPWMNIQKWWMQMQNDSAMKYSDHNVDDGFLSRRSYIFTSTSRRIRFERRPMVPRAVAVLPLVFLTFDKTPTQFHNTQWSVDPLTNTREQWREHRKHALHEWNEWFDSFKWKLTVHGWVESEYRIVIIDSRVGYNTFHFESSLSTIYCIHSEAHSTWFRVLAWGIAHSVRVVT